MKPSVPTYALYGEHEKTLSLDSLHCESIPQRSRLHDWEIKLHRHDLFVQILYIRKGQAQIQFEGHRAEVRGPCALYVPALHDHGFRFSQDVDGAVLTIVAQQLDKLLAQDLDLLSSFNTPHHIPLDDQNAGATHFTRALEHLLEEYDDSQAWRLSVLESLLRTVLILLGRKIATSSHQATGERPSRSVLHLRHFKTLLNSGFRGQHHIAHYAGKLGITPTQLNRICRDELGLSALGVINERLLIEARRDLAYSSLSIKEIALTLGFSDPAYFSRFFSKHSGASPSAFRTMIHHQLNHGRHPDTDARQAGVLAPRA